jgi:UDP-N-acetylglucosamine 2-epimerase (non-hydrolysing)
MKLLSVVGARPNFMKIAPLAHAVAAHGARGGRPIEHVLVHTGQHYDPALSDRFFRELAIPEPDHHLEVGSGTHAYQVGMTMIGFEPVMLAEKPDWVVVVGDVNATCACALTAKKHQIRVCHVEAGLRSFDESMPEEINRVVTDRLSDLLFTTCAFADENLAQEGIAPQKIVRVGNVMIDTLERHRGSAADRDVRDVLRTSRPEGLPPASLDPLGPDGFGVLTLHRPSNVDDPATLKRNIDLVLELSETVPLVFPVHPRTAGRFREFGLVERLARHPRVALVEPLGYVDLLALTRSARIVLTDSGGIQEECCVMGTPCLTLRANTERPATLAANGGTNHLVGTDPDGVRTAFHRVLTLPRQPSRPPLWDGHAAERILAALLERTPS